MQMQHHLLQQVLWRNLRLHDMTVTAIYRLVCMLQFPAGPQPSTCIIVLPEERTVICLPNLYSFTVCVARQ